MVLRETGLSPRERGNHRGRHRRRARRGSIPARAGEPTPYRPTDRRAPVYPRASGGTVEDELGVGTGYGLSPRERGNLDHDPVSLVVRRSIPARAGEPPRSAAPFPVRAVYPRASGGTSGIRRRAFCRLGLSPRERGNLAVGQRPVAYIRSIPARAGEPAPGQGPTFIIAVYPRASGGTISAGLQNRTQESLSPRERGNRNLCCRTPISVGSIPARAGEPT